MPDRILVTIPMQERHREALASAAPGADIRYVKSGEETAEEIRGADIILGNVRAEPLAGSARLKWLQLNSAGADRYIEPGALPEGCLLTNATGAYGLAISEHMLAMLLELMKKLHVYKDNQRQHLWKDEGGVTSIYGAKTLVVGLGDIGSEFARRLHALGATVTGIRRHEAEKPPFVEAVYQLDRLDTLLPDMDIVALCLPGTGETLHLFDKKRLDSMKPGSILLNVGRGSAVCTDALCQALYSGRLGGAGLDVTEPEPLPSDHPLWDAPNLVLTPHVSGFYHLPETLERIIGICIDNVRAYYAGQPLRNLVDPETGYRRFTGQNTEGVQQ